ncbi:MAG TPA: hypothetical protein VM577_01170 [Anaerovoracaceae bacterium]|nr:hypothetical protein [Anaerovoracaceae bacterium]
MERFDTKKVVTSGILLALSTITLLGATFVPGIELTLYALSSVYAAIIIIEFSVSTGWLFYFASVILAFILVPNVAGLIPYTIFFGIYAMIKYYIENLKKFSQPVEIIIKLVFCNLMFALGFIFFGTVFTGAIQIPNVALPIILIGAQVFFLAYDYILTLVIGLYLKRRPKA